MSLSNRQKALLHAIPAKLGLDESHRRIIQRNVGGFHSGADRTATREGFIAVMAFYEGRAGGRLDPFTGGYWKRQNEIVSPGDSVRELIRRQAEQMGWTLADVERFLSGKHMTGGQYSSLEEATEYWLSRLLTALRTIAARRAPA